MSRDEKDLRLVKPRPPTADEVDAEAAALGGLLGAGDLEGDDHEAILAMVLGDDAADVSPEERAEAEGLARALEGQGGHPLADLASALRLADCDVDLEVADHEALLAVALGTEVDLVEPLAAHAELAAALRAAHEPAPLHEADGEVLLALGLGVEARSVATEAHRTLEEVLVAAHRPHALDPVDAALLEALALGHEGKDAEVVDGVRRADAERFAAALTGDADHALLGLAEALRAADDRGRSLDDFTGERLLRERLRAAPPRAPWLAGLVAVAAAIVLFASFGTRSTAPVAELAPAPDFVEVHSTASLFSEPFAAKGGESARMNRIVAARAADLRHNRFAAWGVE